MSGSSCGRAVEPPLTGNAAGTWHAVGLILPANPHYPGTVLGLERGVALCRVWADPVPKFAEFTPELWRESLCHTCGWLRAIQTRTVTAWLARLGAGPGRGLAGAVAAAVLAAAVRDWGIKDIDHGDPPVDIDDGDVESAVALLAAVSAHAGVALLEDECAEYGCDHWAEGPTGAGCPPIGFACHACSLRDLDEDHRYRAEATVGAPCSVLLTLAASHGVTAAIGPAVVLPLSGTHDLDAIDRAGGPPC